MRYPISKRENKVSVKDFGNAKAVFPECLPDILAGSDLRKFITTCKRAIGNNEDVAIMLGGHVIKTGCSPFIIELMRKGSVTHIAMNGGAMIHDYEIGMFGGTSESVEENLPAGKFGMWEETCKLIDMEFEVGLGTRLGWAVRERGLHALQSILGEANRLAVPVSVHTALGADFIHDPRENLDQLMRGLEKDLRLMDDKIRGLSERAIVINFGSAVILPEVWLKCLSRGVNAGHDYSGVTCANFDMNRPYRAIEQIVKRPRLLGMTTYNFVGHHEIMIPLIIKAILA